jgi:hypothetical protein
VTTLRIRITWQREPHYPIAESTARNSRVTQLDAVRRAEIEVVLEGQADHVGYRVLRLCPGVGIRFVGIPGNRDREWPKRRHQAGEAERATPDDCGSCSHGAIPYCRAPLPPAFVGC